MSTFQVFLLHYVLCYHVSDDFSVTKLSVFAIFATQLCFIDHGIKHVKLLWHLIFCLQYIWDELGTKRSMKPSLHFQNLCLSLPQPPQHKLKKISTRVQFNKLPSSVPVQYWLSPIWTETCIIIPVRPHQTHPPTNPPRASIFKPLLDYIGSWNLEWKLYSTQLGQLGN